MKQSESEMLAKGRALTPQMQLAQENKKLTISLEQSIPNFTKSTMNNQPLKVVQLATAGSEDKAQKDPEGLQFIDAIKKQHEMIDLLLKAVQNRETLGQMDRRYHNA